MDDNSPVAAAAAVIVLDNLEHHVSTSSLAGFLKRQGFEPGTSWENIVVVKKKMEEEAEEAGSVVIMELLEEGDEGVQVDNSTSDISSSSSLKPEVRGPSSIITEVPEPEEELDDEDDKFQHRGFIVCCDENIAACISHHLVGQRLFGKLLNLRLAGSSELEELREYEAAQLLVPNILVTCTCDECPMAHMQLPMVQDLLRVLNWDGSISIDEMAEDENHNSENKFILTVTTAEEAEEVVKLCNDINFLEFKIYAELLPISDQTRGRKRNRELEEHCDNMEICNLTCPQYPSISSQQDSGLGLSLVNSFSHFTDYSGSTSIMNSTPGSFEMSASYLNSAPAPGSLDMSTSFNYSSIHVVPKGMTTPPDYSEFVPLRFLIPESFTKCLIGHNQLTVEWIVETSKASVAILEKQFYIRGNNGVDKVVVVFGAEASYKMAIKMILHVFSQEIQARISLYGSQFGSVKAATNDFVREDGTMQFRMPVFNSITGRLIGKLGKNLKNLVLKTNTEITISSTSYTWDEHRTDPDRIVSIVGSSENVLQAVYLIANRVCHAFLNEYKHSGITPDVSVLPNVPQLQTIGQPHGIFMPPVPVPPQPQMCSPYMSIPLPPQYSTAPGCVNICNQNQNIMEVLPPSSSAVASSAISTIMMNGTHSLTALRKPPCFEPNKWVISRIYCPNKAINMIIGSKGSNIHYIRETTNILVEVNNSTLFIPFGSMIGSGYHPRSRSRNQNIPDNEATESQLILSGAFQHHDKAQFLIFNTIGRYYKMQSNQAQREVHLTIEIGIPTKYVARIIGKNGTKLQNIESATCTFIQFNTDGFVRGRNSNISETTSVKILGTFGGVRDAQAKIYSLVENFYSSEIQTDPVPVFQTQQQPPQQQFRQQPPQQILRPFEAHANYQHQQTDCGNNFVYPPNFNNCNPMIECQTQNMVYHNNNLPQEESQMVVPYVNMTPAPAYFTPKMTTY